jgi:tetratricopeptide (TPR) repeat protein
MDRRKNGEEVPFSEFVITRSITCPKCGAVDQYEMTGEAMLAFTAELIKLAARREGSPEGTPLPGDDGEERLVPIRFTLADGREMHPYAALEMYRRQVAEDPDNAKLRLGYAKVLSFLGRRDAALEQYQTVVRADPANVEAFVDLGILARDAGDREEARRMFNRVLDVIGDTALSEQEREDYVRFAFGALEEVMEEELAQLGIQGRGSGSAAEQRRPGSAGAGTALQAPRRTRKVGRNDPCPCGSGKKYKKCHGR